jgi:hypothetical protein
MIYYIFWQNRQQGYDPIFWKVTSSIKKKFGAIPVPGIWVLRCPFPAGKITTGRE